MNSAFTFFTKLPILRSAGLIGGVDHILFLFVLVFVVIIMLLEILKHDFSNIFNKIESFWLRKNNTNWIFRWIVYYILIAMIIVYTTDGQEFIYLQF